MCKQDDAADRDDIVRCANASCDRPYRAVKLVPTISGPDQHGKLYCPYCGRSVAADARYLWIGLRV